MLGIFQLSVEMERIRKRAKSKIQKKIDSNYIRGQKRIYYSQRTHRKKQEPWINCMRYGIDVLKAKGADSNRKVLNSIVPSFRANSSYPDKEAHGERQLAYDEHDPYSYQSYTNITNLYRGSSHTNCFDAAVSVYVISQYLGCIAKGNQVSQNIDVLIKKPWWRKAMKGDDEALIETDDQFNRWISTLHTYLLFAKRYVYDPTPAWANTPTTTGPAQKGQYTQGQFFEYMNERYGRKSRWGTDCTSYLTW